MERATVNTRAVYLIAGGAVAAALAYTMARGVKETGAQIGGAVVDMADGVVSGVVIGIGEKVGIPPTNTTKCEADMAAGRTWAASFSCPAGTFLKYLWE